MRLVFTLLIMFFITGLKAQQVITVPQTEVTGLLMTDGQFDKEEWRDAKVIEISKKDSVYLYLKNHRNFILLGIKMPFKMLAYIDMFVDFDKGYVQNFHSSAQLAERILTDTSWTDLLPVTHWGNAAKWYANESRMDRAKAEDLLKADPTRDRTKLMLETTYPYQGYEYIFSKERFMQKNWKVRIEVRNNMPGYSTVIFPADSERKNSLNWQKINFQ